MNRPPTGTPAPVNICSIALDAVGCGWLAGSTVRPDRTSVAVRAATAITATAADRPDVRFRRRRMRLVETIRSETDARVYAGGRSSSSRSRDSRFSTVHLLAGAAVGPGRRDVDGRGHHGRGVRGRRGGGRRGLYRAGAVGWHGVGRGRG